MQEQIHLQQAGAKWWHTDDYHSPNLSKSSLGEFFHVALSEGVQIGTVWPFNHKHSRSLVVVTVFATDAQKSAIESKTRYRLRPPPVVRPA